MPRTGNTVTVSLPAGEYFVGNGDCRMRTVLGAGVVITLWRRAHVRAAMAHFQVTPHVTEPALALGGHCGKDGMQLMLQTLHPEGTALDDVEARICGSGKILMQTDQIPSFNSGQSSGEMARQLLRNFGIPIVTESFYAIGHHEITFDAHTGRVRARRIKSALVEAAARFRAPPAQGPGPRLVTLLR